MKKQLAFLAALAALSTSIQAQDMYVGVGLPGLVAIGYAHPMATNWGLRGEYSGGISVSKDSVEDGVNVAGSIKANRLGVFADWFPLGGGFRLVGGLTVNDIKAEFKGIGTGGSTINGKPVNLAGEAFNVTLKYPSTTPYLGIGYGHQSSAVKGLGFYADLGVMIGSFDAEVSTTLVGKQGLTQADIDAQSQKMRDSVSGLSVLPTFSIGAVYRF